MKSRPTISISSAIFLCCSFKRHKNFKKGHFSSFKTDKKFYSFLLPFVVLFCKLIFFFFFRVFLFSPGAFARQHVFHAVPISTQLTLVLYHVAYKNKKREQFLVFSFCCNVSRFILLNRHLWRCASIWI